MAIASSSPTSGSSPGGGRWVSQAGSNAIDGEPRREGTPGSATWRDANDSGNASDAAAAPRRAIARMATSEARGDARSSATIMPASTPAARSRAATDRVDASSAS
jgi:hypothetical protein